MGPIFLTQEGLNLKGGGQFDGQTSLHIHIYPVIILKKNIGDDCIVFINRSSNINIIGVTCSPDQGIR